MKKKIAGSLLLLIVVLLSIPIGNLLLTKFGERKSLITQAENYSNNTKDNPEDNNKHYTNDASQLNKTQIAQKIDVPSDKAAIVAQLQQLIKIAKSKQQKISIAGARHSMGGHTMYPDGILLNMLPYNDMQFDAASNQITVGSGALWSDVIQYLDKYDKSVAIMQSVSSFSVGGSLSVNGHGWQSDVPPISSSVQSFTLMTPRGDIVKCSRDTNTELFNVVLGGYGLFGVILDVTLQVVDNTAVQYKPFIISVDDYVDYYQKQVINQPNVNLVYGRLNVTKHKFLEQAVLSVFERVDRDIPAYNASKDNELQRLVLRSSVESEYGKAQRWVLEKASMLALKNHIFSRNQLLNNEAKYIANKQADSTDILHEYFIPIRHFDQYVADIKPILQASGINLINITIRAVNKDEDTVLTYANEDVFGFVFLFNQQKSERQELQMTSLTQQLADVAIANEGTYYLPYRLHVDRATMREAYPRADEFFALKLKYDPQEMFNSQFYQHYK